MADFEFNLGDVPEGFGGDLDSGNYTARLMSAPEMTLTKQDNKPMLSARYEILEGPAKGKEQVLRYVLEVTTDSNGKPKFSQGLINLKRDLKAIGEAIPDGFKLTTKNAVKFYGSKFKDKLTNINARKYKPKGWKDGDDYGTSYSITGLAQMGANAGAAHPAGIAALPGAGATTTTVDEEDPDEFD